MAKNAPLDYGDNASWAARVEEGVAIADLASFGKEAGFSSDQLARWIQIPARTYARRRATRSRLKLDEGERAVRLMRLYDRARSVLGADQRAREWLHRPLAVLGGRSPLDYARTEPGAREVEAVLGRFEDGVFS